MLGFFDVGDELQFSFIHSLPQVLRYRHSHVNGVAYIYIRMYADREIVISNNVTT